MRNLRKLTGTSTGNDRKPVGNPSETRRRPVKNHSKTRGNTQATFEKVGSRKGETLRKPPTRSLIHPLGVYKGLMRQKRSVAEASECYTQRREYSANLRMAGNKWKTPWKSVENLARNFAVEHASATRKLMENAREPAETRSELGLRKCAARRKAARVSGGFPQVSWRFLLA